MPGQRGLSLSVPLLTMALLAMPVTSVQEIKKANGLEQSIVAANGEDGQRKSSRFMKHGTSSGPSNVVQLLLGGLGTCQTRPLPDAGQLYRENYNRHTRCHTSGSEEICQECQVANNADDCWKGADDDTDGAACTGGTFIRCCTASITTDCKNATDGCHAGELDRSYLKISATDSSYIRHINRAFVTKGGSSVKVIGQNIQQTDGTLKFYMDGAEFHTGAGDINHEWGGSSSNAALTSGEPHEFVIIFTPTSHPSSAEIGMLYFEMEDSDLSCKETFPENLGSGSTATDTTCFFELDPEQNQHALHMRGNNDAMMDCLNAQTDVSDAHHTACNEYKTCLPTDKEDLMKDMFNARIGKFPKDHNNGASACTPDAADDSANPACWNPITEDLYDLNCQCATHFNIYCTTTCSSVARENCLTAIACGHSKVCQSWKNCYCNQVTTGTGQDHCTPSTSSSLLQANASFAKSLLVRRDTTALTDASTVDQTTTHKCTD